jgi:serine/threonine-protein phosphatase 2A regulatory subunit B'
MMSPYIPQKLMVANISNSFVT